MTVFERALQHLGVSVSGKSGTAVWQDLLGDLKEDLKNCKTERLALTLLMDHFYIVALAKKFRISWKDTCTLSETVLMETVRSVSSDEFGGLGANISNGVNSGRARRKTGPSGLSIVTGRDSGVLGKPVGEMSLVKITRRGRYISQWHRRIDEPQRLPIPLESESLLQRQTRPLARESIRVRPRVAGEIHHLVNLGNIPAISEQINQRTAEGDEVRQVRDGSQSVHHPGLESSRSHLKVWKRPQDVFEGSNVYPHLPGLNGPIRDCRSRNSEQQHGRSRAHQSEQNVNLPRDDLW